VTLCELVGGEFDGQRLETPFVKSQINMTDANGQRRETYVLRIREHPPLFEIAPDLKTYTWELTEDGAALYDVVRP
jgi:hypothetical protein